MKIFLTGASGFLGGHVLEGLLQAGHQVTAFGRKPINRDDIQFVKGDLNQVQDLSAGLKGHDAVVHLAGLVSRDPKDATQMHLIHVTGTRALLDAMETAGVKRIVLASTSGTIAVSEDLSYCGTERDNASRSIIGQWPYYLSKKLQEEEVLRRTQIGSIESVILNPSLILGPGDRRMTSTEDVLNILHGRIPVLTDGVVAFADVRDVAAAFISALEKGKSGQRYLLNGANMALRTFVERVARLGGVRMPVLKLPSKFAVGGAKFLSGLSSTLGLEAPGLDPVTADMSRYSWACDSSLAEAALGFSPRDPQETLYDTIRYLIERGAFRKSA